MTRTSRRTPTKRTAVVILSMHRSGTSALTRVLSLLGCTLPKTLIAGRKDDNDAGFWESQAVVDVNEAICVSAGSNWNDWVSLSPRWLSSPVRRDFVNRAHEVLKDEFGDSRLFVLKDPRLCRLMPVWAEALDLFGARPAYVLPIRNPLEVAASLRKRNQLVEGDSYLAWLRHTLDAERHSRDQPRVFTRYEDLLGNWRQVTDRISDKLGLDWPNQPVSVQDDIDSFLAPGLRHHRVEDFRVFEDAHFLPWLTQCYEVMSRWTRDQIRPDDLEMLDRINSEMTEVAPAFESIFAEARVLGKERRELVKRIEGADAVAREQGKALGLAQAELAERNRQLQMLRVERDENAANLVAAQTELTQLRDRASRADNALAQRLAELNEITGELEKLRLEVAERDERLKELDSKRAADQEEARLALYHVSQEASSQLAEQELALGATKREIETLHNRVSNAEAELAWTRTELERESENAKEAAAKCSLLSSQLQDSQSRAGEFATHAWSLLSEHMRHLRRAIHPPQQRIFSRLSPWQRFRLRRIGEELRRSAEELRSSTYFDADWYLVRNVDVADAGMDPALHFIEYGFQEGRAPNARFEESR